MKKRICLIFVLQFFLSFLFCEELTNFNTSWNLVLTGSPIYEPVKTSYGFSLINDARMLQTFSDSGKLLWEKPVGRGRNPEVKCIKHDFFIIFSSNNSEIRLLNPSGTEIWKKELDISVSQLLDGRDGRIFLAGENELYCFGITGIEKWHLTTDKISTVPLSELPDGSFIVFLSESVQNKTKGLRINPFGEVIEEILFASIVSDAITTENGVLIHFATGDAGLISLSEDYQKTENKWLLKNTSSSSSKLISDGKNAAFLKQEGNSLKTFELNLSDGKFVSQVSFEMNIKNIEIAELEDKGIFLFDGKNGIYKTFSGQTLFSANIKDTTEMKYLYSFYTNKADLILCKEDWAINAYKITEKTHKNQNKSKDNSNYSTFYKNIYSDYIFLNTTQIDSSVYSHEKSEKLFSGNYGADEIKWISQLDFYITQYTNYLNNKSKKSESTVFDYDSTGVEQLLLQMSYYSSNQFTHQAASILRKTNKESDIYAVLSGVTLNGYDPQRDILDSIEIAALKVSPSNDKLIKKICDAVYSITFFMGRPAFNSKGKQILAGFLTPTYSDKSRNYVRQTLKKITELGL